MAPAPPLPPPPLPPPPLAPATQFATQYNPQFTPPPGPKPGPNKWALIGGGSAAAVLAIAGGLMYSSSVEHQHEVERQRTIAQRQDAENRRQAAIRQERDEQTKAEEERSARELTNRVKREQEAAEAQVQAEAKARNLATAEKSARLAAQQAAQRAAQPNQAGQGVNAPTYQKLNGMWRGTYICAQGQTAAQLLINATPQGVTAAMAFAVPNAKPGTFLMNGKFVPGNGQLTLQFVRWGNRPPNYSPADLTGTVDLNQGVITGRVIAPGCSTFVIRRQ
jgi:hypothetical protein